MTSTKPVVDNKSVSISLKPKTEKFYISHFKRNNKENAYFVRLDKGKSSDVDTKVSRPMSKPIASVQNKYVFVPTCHIYGVVGYIRPNCSLLRKKPKSETRFVVRNTDVPKFVPSCHFCGKFGHIRPNSFKLQAAKRTNKPKVPVPQAQDPMVLIGELVKALNFYSNPRVGHHSNGNNNSNARVASKRFWMQKA